MIIDNQILRGQSDKNQVRQTCVKCIFSVCGPDVCNSLPRSFKLIDFHAVFRTALKTYFAVTVPLNLLIGVLQIVGLTQSICFYVYMTGHQSCLLGTTTLFSKRERITLRLLYARRNSVCLSVCCLSSVTLVQPTQAVKLFGNLFLTIR